MLVFIAFVAGVLWFIAFCVLCGIYSRLGEARDLLRYLAEQIHEVRLKAGKSPPRY